MYTYIKMSLEDAEKFCTDYDFESLDKFQKYKKELVKIAKKHRSAPATIIVNHFTKKYPHPEYLSGILCLSYMTSEKYDMKVYFLHDIHLRHGECKKGPKKYDPYSTKPRKIMYIDQWLVWVLGCADVFVDVFLETDPLNYSTKNVYHGFSNIKNIRQKLLLAEWDVHYDTLNKVVTLLHECYEGKQCFTNSRVHWANYRNVLTPNSIGTMDKDGSAIHRLIAEHFYMDNSKDVLQILWNLIIDIVNTTKIIKQLNACPPEVKDTILDSVKKYINELYQILVQAYHHRRSYYGDEVRSTLITHVTSFIMDLYLLGRLFRTFEPKNKSHPRKVHNAIVYAGAYHTLFYEDVLYKLGFKMKYRTEERFHEVVERFFARGDINAVNQCVNVSDMPYPLFR